MISLHVIGNFPFPIDPQYEINLYTDFIFAKIKINNELLLN